MLLDPYSEGAIARAKSILYAEVTVESFKRQIPQGIRHLKGLKAAQKDQFKLYRGPAPLNLTDAPE